MTQPRSFRLNHKIIVLDYILIVLLTGGIVLTSLYEWRTIEHLKADTERADFLRQGIHEVYVQMGQLSFMGETITEWDEEDFSLYHDRHQKLDTLLRNIGAAYPDEHTDSIRALLDKKEQQLHDIMQILQRQEKLNEQLAERLPAITRTSIQEPPKKRSGFLGLFGKKNKQTATPTTTMLRLLNHDVVESRQEQARKLSEYMELLTARNGDLNRQLQGFISRMDRSIQSELARKETDISSTRARGFLVICGLTGIAVLLLSASYLVIRRNIRRINRYKQETAELIAKLETALRENKEMSANRHKLMLTITHELRTPLAAIIGYADLVPRETERGKRHLYMQNIRLSASRMNSLLETLLNFYRLESGKEQPSPSPFRLRGMADMMQANFLPQAEQKDLVLDVTVEGDSVLVGDKERIIQICDNLLSNAVKYTDHGTVGLRMEHKDGTLTTVIEDTGGGMSREEQERAFEAFERLSNAATQDGFGLGLPIVHRLVKLLGGTIRMESEKGKGSRFTVSLPVEEAGTLPKVEKAVPTNSRPSNAVSVVALDNDSIILSMIREMYSRQGIHCDTCTNVSDLMELIRQRDYDLLLTDLKMPEMNGYDVLDLLRSSNIGNSRHIPVIVMTASGSCTGEELLERGFTGCLFKPFSLSELTAVSAPHTGGKGDRANVPDLPDFTSLLAYGDKKEMLGCLITETRKDMDAVRKIISERDRKALEEKVHHLRSSWTLIRADRPLRVLQELLQGTSEHSEEEMRQAADAVLETGERIVRMAEEERRRHV